MDTTFKTIGLIGRHADSGITGTLQKLSHYLAGLNLTVLTDEATGNNLPELGLTALPRHSLGQRCDLVIVVGGDGTLLNVARSLVEYQVPIVGINLGRLGFLADISAKDMLSRVEKILRGEYVAEDRFMLTATTVRNNQSVNMCNALNEVVVHKWNTARMIEMETKINGKLVDVQRSDGLIVSTPTGSTAYALSGGGPILHPTLNALVLVPICPHTLSNRPIVVSGDSYIQIKIRDCDRDHAQLTNDGQTTFGLIDGDIIQIKKKDQPIRLLHPKDHDHFKILREKLRWGSRAAAEKA